MSTPLKVIIMLLAWFLFSLVAYRGCVRPQCCGDATTTGTTGVIPPTAEDSAAVAASSRYPIDFQYASSNVFTNDGYDALRSRLVRETNPNNTIEITGLYYESEPTPEGYENMGFARADAVKQLLLPDIAAERISLRARALSDDEAVREGYFEGTRYNVVPTTEQPAPAGESKVEELDDRVVITFPYNSAQKNVDDRVDDYLDRLAAQMKSNANMRVSITGHTDNRGDDAYNLQLGRERAVFVQNILVSKGVDRARITTDSRGETQPVATNDTEAGRQDNRRAELRITTDQ